MNHDHRSSNQGSPESFPPLPDDLPLEGEAVDADATTATPSASSSSRRSLRGGAYLIRFAPSGNPLVCYDGTVRVQRHAGGRTASGDLYQRPIHFLPPPLSRPILGPAPKPAAGIPILPVARYRYYLRITRILERSTTAKSFTLGFEMHRFEAATATWTNEGPFTARMTWTPAPAGYPSPSSYLTGSVKNSAKVVVGNLTMGWVSKYLRKATVEIDRVQPSEAPLGNGAGETWRTVFDCVDWDLTVVDSNANVIEPSGDSWSDAELHAGMLARRDPSSLDTEWRYHVLAVRNLDSTPRGIMYDNGATDSNNVPREGVGISSHWVIPDLPEWGLVRNMRFGTAAKPYFRTIVHEVGHGMGLYHNTVDNGFMNTTDVIAGSATPANPFPNNIQWSYAADDEKRLRHMPDIHVRPGGTPFGTSYATTPISPDDLADEATELTLEVSPLLEAVPLGAPVRVNLKLVNRGTDATLAPATLGLGGGFVSGRVIGPQEAERGFSPLQICLDAEPLTVLAPAGTITGSLTLLRGGQGALFPSPGIHVVEVTATWHIEGISRQVTGRTQVMVMPAQDEAHAAAAMKVLATPDTLLTLVLGGDHLPEGIAAVKVALANPVLRPHFAYVEAKRQLDRFGARKPNAKAADELIDDTTVMSNEEMKRLFRRVETARAQNGDAAAATLASKVKSVAAKRAAPGIADEL